MIGGLVPCSFIDFPGCLSAVVFLQGCNLRCPYCHNPKLLDTTIPGAMEKDELLAFLYSRRGLLSGVVFSGGEPTLHPELHALIEVARSLDFKVKLDTNGTQPEVLIKLIDARLLDYIAMDLKDEPNTYASWLGYKRTARKLQISLDLVKYSGIDHELRTTIVWPYHNEDRLNRMARWAMGCQRWFLQPCTSTKTSQTVFAQPVSLNLTMPAQGLSTCDNTPSGITLEEIASRLSEKHGIDVQYRSGVKCL